MSVSFRSSRHSIYVPEIGGRLAVSTSMTVPTSHPTAEEAVRNMMPVTRTPRTIEAEMIRLEIAPEVTGTPNRLLKNSI